MIEKRTVLVLGAGASKPYGFPTGRELIREIAAGLKNTGSEVAQLLSAHGHEPSELAKFSDALLDSAQPSVDVFLENRAEYLEAGKAAIAAALEILLL